MPEPVLRRGPPGVGAEHVIHEPGVRDGLGAPLSQVGAELKVGVVVRLTGHVADGNEDTEPCAPRDQRRHDHAADAGVQGSFGNIGVRQPTGLSGLVPCNQDWFTGPQGLAGYALGSLARVGDHIVEYPCLIGIVVVRHTGQQQRARLVEQLDKAAVTKGFRRLGHHPVKDHLQLQA